MVIIRSQDKTTITKVSRVSKSELYQGASYYIYGDNYILGVYSTEEKVLKILDEIHSHINYIKSNQLDYVFQMPQDNVV